MIVVSGFEILLTGDTRHFQIVRGILVQLINRCWSWYLRVKKEDLRRALITIVNHQAPGDSKWPFWDC